MSSFDLGTFNGHRVPLSRRRFLCAAAIGVPALLVACTSPATPGPANPTEPPPNAPQATAAPTSAQQPVVSATSSPATTAKRGGVVEFSITSDPLLNPIMTGDVSGVVITKLLFNGLTRPDRKTLEPSPDLAVSWEPSEDGAVWTFVLREGVKWHDGAPFTAEDVKFTFESILDPSVNTVMRGHFRSVKGIDALDSKTVRFALSEPFAAFPTFMGHLGTVSLGIIPKHILQNVDLNTATSFNKQTPIGTGPFKIKEFKAADHATLEAYDDYHFGRPFLDVFNWKIIPDANTTMAQLLSGELTGLRSVTPQQADALKNNAEIVVQRADSVNYSYLGVNKSRPLFKDVRVRKALMHSVNRPAINEKFYLNQNVMANGPIPPTIEWAYEENVTKYGYDPDTSKALLEDAGWKPGSDGVLVKDGERFSFKITASRNPTNEQLAALYQQSWKALGIETTIELLEFGVFIAERRDSHDYDLMLHGWLVPPDPDQFNYFHSTAIESGLNAGEYDNPEVDRLLEEGRRTLDQAKRKVIYSQFQKIMADDLPELWMWYGSELRALSRRLKGLASTKSIYDVELHYANEWYLE